MKKNLLKVSLLCLLFLCGCKKFLTETPLTGVISTNYFKSAKDINSALAGIYDSFQVEMTGDGVSTTSSKFNFWGDARSDVFDVSRYPNTTMQELALNQLTSQNTSAEWAGLYRTINRANLAIVYIPLTPQYDNTVTSTVVNNSLAQCYAMRAECYFYIVRIWGDAVVRTEPYTDITVPAAKARTPKDEVINNVIIPDLTKAYSLIQKGQTNTVWYIGEAAICAMLADVYMWQHDYANAIIWTKKLFNAKNATGALYTGGAANLETTANWKNNFITPASSIETIWSINWDNANDGCACIPISAQKINNAIRVDSLFIDTWKRAAKTDTRVLKTIDTLFNTSATGTGVGHQDKVYKYYNLPATGIPTTYLSDPTALNVYLTMYRLADVYLSYAEALNYTGDKANALIYLNYIRVRAGLTALLANDPSISTTEKFEDVILAERRYELMAEGKRWFDLVRTGRVNTIMDPIINYRAKRLGVTNASFGADQNKILWPILRANLEYNPLLVQNPSYY
jgi:hypothetical protein